MLVLAAAGLERLGRRREAGGTLHGEVFVPAAGQGVIAVQARAEEPCRRGRRRRMPCPHPRMPAGRADRRARIGRKLSHARGNPRAIACGFAASRACPTAPQWLVDEVPVAGGEDRQHAFEAAGRELAQRMLAAGAADLLRDAEAMAAR